MKLKKLGSLLVVSSAAAFVFSTNAVAQQDSAKAQDPAKATESVIQTTDKIENLRAQITEIETKKASLQDKIRQLDDAMLPENLERTTVTAGSTHPEDLRENRRLQLETEKKAAQSQIDLLEQSRQRIELSIATTAPKPVPAETASSAKTKNEESNSAPTADTQNTVAPEVTTNTTTAAPPNTPLKRSPARLKRKRVVKIS